MVVPSARFGKLTVIGYGPNRSDVAVTCDCGTEKTVKTSNLMNGSARSCGCVKKLQTKKSRDRFMAMLGERFGRWVVTEVFKDGYNFKCRVTCDCGKQRVRHARSLLNGDSTSCRCARIQKDKEAAIARWSHLIGQRFGRLVVEAIEANGSNSDAVVLCDCGQRKLRQVHAMLHGPASQSCGCWVAELTSAREGTHRLSGTPEFASYIAMKHRCLNESRENYSRYGGAGVTICERLMDPLLFVETLGNRPPGTSIDRIDSTKGYWCGECEECQSKGRVNNVRWATAITQANNNSRNVRIEARGESHTTAEWSRISGVKRETIANRVKRGWPPEEAIFKTPLKPGQYRT
jgi:hypothetical protein